MKPIRDGLKKLFVLGYTAGQGGGMVCHGPRERTARSRSRGADRAFRAAFVATLLGLLLLPGHIDAQPGAADSNRYVTLRATPSMAGAVSYSRPLFPGQHLVFPVAGREGHPAIYVQVSQEGLEALRRGEFQGRLIPFRAAGGRYAGVGNYVRSHLDGAVHGGTWLLVDGATPRAMMWAPFLVTFLVALALTDLALLGRLLRPAKD